MSARAPVAAFDIGAESGRLLVGSFDGATLDLSERARFVNCPVRLPEGLYWNVLGLYAEVVGALQGLGDERPRSVGIDTWGVDFGLIDAGGTLVANPLHYRDGRGVEAMRTAFARVPQDRIYQVTGIQFMPINTAYQLIALEGTPALERAERLLLIPDLLGYWLTGSVGAEVTNASTTQLLDVGSSEWAWRLIRDLGLPSRLFPPMVESGSMLGQVREEVAPGRIPLVAVASHDTASAVVATPFASPDAAYIASGTWSLVGVERTTPLLGSKAMAGNFTNERGFGGTVRLLKNVMGLWLLQELRRTWPSEGAAPSYAEISALAAEAPSGGPLFNPNSPELLAPGAMAERIHDLCQRTCGTAPREIGTLLRSVYESLACAYRHALDELEAATERAIDVVHLVGGGSRDRLLCELTAMVTGRTVLAGPSEAAASGNVLVQLYALRELASLDDMRDLIRRSTRVVEYDPADGAGEGAALYDRYRANVVGRALERAN